MSDRVESLLHQTLARAQPPPRLAAAMAHAVFPGGARLRPRLCLAVAAAAGGDARAAEAALAPAAAVELLHCASLVHDDLPCFDDAALRRGQPTVHRRHGEALAVLAGDALIVAAFAALAAAQPAAVAEVAAAAARLVAGQGEECEPQVALAPCHAGKTGALFAAAAACGALAAGDQADRWRPLGLALGRAYQLADDIADASEDAAAANVVRAVGPDAAHAALAACLAEARAAVPPCRAPEALDAWLAALAARLPGRGTGAAVAAAGRIAV